MNPLLFQLTMNAAGITLIAWAFWRLNETGGRGDWTVKLSVLAVFATACVWLFDSLTGNDWRVDGLALLVAIDGYLWWGVWKHHHANRRGQSRSDSTSPGAAE